MSQARTTPGAARVAPTYLAALVATVFAAVGLFYAALASLDAQGRLPPPAFSNSLCRDEKLRHLRDHKVEAPNLLVIGSSVAWRHVDGAALARDVPGVVEMNAGFCGLHVGQSVFVGEWLLDHHATVTDVLLIAGPNDFKDCSSEPAAVFNREDVDRYVYGRAPSWGYYLSYFDPVSMFHNAGTVGEQRRTTDQIDPLVFDRYEDGPITTQETRPLGFTAVYRMDPACVVALQRFNARLQREGRRLHVAESPINPNWFAAYDPAGDTTVEVAHAVARLPGVEVWNGARGVVPPTAFIDALHMRWSGAILYTDAMAHALHLHALKAAVGRHHG
jgi:hypothetical protein